MLSNYFTEKEEENHKNTLLIVLPAARY